MVERLEPWSASWFGEEYLAVYPERDDREVLRRARFAAEVLRPYARQGRIGFLDLSCGTGRHAVGLDAWGETAGVAGLGLSLPALAEGARRPIRPRPGYVRGDMRRIPFREAAFGAVVNFSTAFGAFDRPEDDAAVLREVRRVLAPGGAFLSEVFNAARVIATLASREEKTIAGQRIVIRRRYDREEGRIEKVIEMGNGNGARCFRERVRPCTEPELRDLHRAAGFEVARAFGDFDGSSFDVRRSPRLVLLAVRPGVA